MEIKVQLHDGSRVSPAVITDPLHLSMFYAMTIRGEALVKARAAFPHLIAVTGESATLFGDIGRMVFCHLKGLSL